MAISFDQFRSSRRHEAPSVSEMGQRLDRSAARAFAAAISSLLIASLVISQSAEAFDPEGTVTGNNLAGGTVSLTDDDEGRSLVDLADMAPGRPATECIVVTYEGTILPVELTFAAVAEGPLAPYVDVEIEQGEGGRYGSCADFVPESTVYTGTLSELTAEEPLGLGSFRAQGESTSFRFEFELQDDGRAIGQATAIDFVWEATP